MINLLNFSDPTPIIPRKKIKLSQLLRTAIEQRKKEKKLVYEGNDILPEYVQIAKGTTYFSLDSVFISKDLTICFLFFLS
jgi:hypothetical protein